jgi:hypothetical protein
MIGNDWERLKGFFCLVMLRSKLKQYYKIMYTHKLFSVLESDLLWGNYGECINDSFVLGKCVVE